MSMLLTRSLRRLHQSQTAVRLSCNGRQSVGDVARRFHSLLGRAQPCHGRTSLPSRHPNRSYSVGHVGPTNVTFSPAFGIPSWVTFKSSESWRQVKERLLRRFSKNANDEEDEVPPKENQEGESEGEPKTATESTVEQENTTFDFKLLLQLLARDSLILLAAVATAIGAAFINIQLPLVLGELVDAVRSADGGVTDFFSAVYPSTARLVGLYGIQAVLTGAYISLLACVGERLAARLRHRLFHSLLNQDVAFFDAHKTGELVNRLTADVQDFKSAFKSCVSQGLRSSVQTVGCAGSLYYVSPKLAGVLVVMVSVMVVGGTLLGAVLRRLSKAAQAQVANSTSLANEVLGNIRTVRAFAMEEAEDSAYEHELQRSSSLYQRLGIGIGIYQGISNFAINGMVLVVLYYGGWLMSQNEITAGHLMSFLASTQVMQRSMAQVSVLFGQVVRGMTAGNRVFEYMKLQPSIPITGGSKIADNLLKGDLVLDGIHFTYPTRPGHIVFDKLNLHIPAGTVVALCGPSGGGKSTIAALVERFYDPLSGSVRLDGQDMRTLDPSWLRGHVIGYINQEPVLFATSVIENIRYGRPNATDEEVLAAAKEANVDEFVRQFPEGYKTVLGERGQTVSGGQRQRIAIARALLKNPRVLILDEATSALDAESERLVQQALDRLCQDRTVLIIAHRLSTIQNADMIAVLVNGVIREKGTHRNLMKKNGVYAGLIRHQSKLS